MTARENSILEPPAEANQLGECVARHDVRTGLVAGVLLMLALGVGMGAAFVACAFLIRPASKANPLFQHGLSFGMGVFLLAGSIYMIWGVVRRFGRRVFQHKDGLAICRRDRISILPWNEIDVVWHKAKTTSYSLEDVLGTTLEGTQCVYALQARNLQRLVLDSYLRGIEPLGRAIELGTIRHLLPRAMKTLNIEGRVDLGKRAVGPDGVIKGNKILPWNDVGRITVEGGLVFVRNRLDKLAWLGVRMGKIPNLHVFDALVATMLAGKPL